MSLIDIRREDTMASAALKTRHTPPEYLALERKACFKSEYFDGFITARAGASRDHNLVNLNIASALNIQLNDRHCQVYVNDLRLLVDPTGLFTYPDVMAVCGEARFLDDEFDTLLNPSLIVEVLSPSTESYDRGAKFAHYRRLPSLKEYVLVSQDKVLVERYARQGENWVLTEFHNLEADVPFLSVDCAVSMTEIYAKTALDPSSLERL